MLLVYYRLYITYTLTGFLFDLDQSNVCRDIQKIESLIRKCVSIPQKTYNITKRLKTPQRKSNNIFLALLLLQIVQNSKYQDLKIKKDARLYYSGKKKRHTVKNQLVVNNQGYIIHKSGHKKGRKHDYILYKKNHPFTPKRLLMQFDLGYLGVEMDFPEQLSSLTI